MKKIELKRIAKRDTYTIGKMYVDGKYVCDTIEDKDRGLSDSMTVEEVKAKKVYGKTAIPTGTYKVWMTMESAKFGKQQFYKDVCKGRLPRLGGVKGFEGILIHCGNTADDSLGCILVGENKIVGKVINSRLTFQKLMGLLKGETDVSITIH